MPVAKKPIPQKETVEEKDPVMCDNHPDIVAVHATGSQLHQSISLCAPCLSRVEHLRYR
ncbi:hypothetical protein [Streptomyces atratus]|uniref:hypothetical protein n=1 Tax=Streptomyces atratus TaxID=1893 RepID=UPI003658FDD2